MRDVSAITVQRAEEARQTSKPALPAITPSGPRKLIRPPLPEGVAARFASRTSAAAASYTEAAESSHAEAFYFQKQIQSQTPMVFILEQGEQIEGQIEWYDRDAIKVKSRGLRTLIYKSSIKYLFKAGESVAK